MDAPARSISIGHTGDFNHVDKKQDRPRGHACSRCSFICLAQGFDPNLGNRIPLLNEPGVYG
jgi:hypothetical protein